MFMSATLKKDLLLISLLLGSSLTVFAVPRVLTKVIASPSQLAHTIAASRVVKGVAKGITWMRSTKLASGLGSAYSLANRHPLLSVAGIALTYRYLYPYLHNEETKRSHQLQQAENNLSNHLMMDRMYTEQQIAILQAKLLKDPADNDTKNKLIYFTEKLDQVLGRMYQHLHPHRAVILSSRYKDGKDMDTAWLNTASRRNAAKDVLNRAENKSHLRRVWELLPWTQKSV